MNQTVRWMMELIRSELTGQDPAPSLFEGMDDGQWNQLYALSKSHDLAHLAGDAAIKHGLLSDGEVKAKFEKQIMTAVFRYQQLQYELDELKRVLNEAKIPFLPLKGSVLRQYYPEPWMRTSCDIDVLVKETDLEKARSVLEAELHYAFAKTSDHDAGATAPSGVHLELHYRLNDESVRRKSDIPLAKVWDYAVTGDDFCRTLRDEMFYYYHIMHMAKHFENGGCGVRPFIDLWILNRHLDCDPAENEKLLAEGGLTTFSETACLLSRVWLEEAVPSPISDQMESYVLTGGVYGTQDSLIAVYQTKKGGNFKYLLYRLWMPYPSLCVMYPSLKGKRILQPFYEIRRWMKLFKRSTFKRSRAEWRASSAVTDEKRSQTAQMLSDLGLI